MKKIIPVLFLLSFLTLTVTASGKPVILIDTTIHLSDDEFLELEKKLESEDPTFRFNFFSENDIQFYLAAQKMRPESFIWIDLINMYFASERYNASQLENEDEKKVLFKNSLSYLTESLKMLKDLRIPNENDSIAKIYSLYLGIIYEDIAFAAMGAEELSLAKQMAKEMLINNTDTTLFNYGITFNQAKTILGCVALRENDLQQAKQYLMKSVEGHKTSDLSFFGPSFILAKELLTLGEKDIVLDFLDLVANIWANPENVKSSDNRKMAANQRRIDQLEKWKIEIMSGKIPNDPSWNK